MVIASNCPGVIGAGPKRANATTTASELCDVADEEVHFSRDVVTRYQPQPLVAASISSGTNAAGPPSTRRPSSALSDINLAAGGGYQSDIDNVYSAGHGRHRDSTASTCSTAVVHDQVMSAKLLSSIGSQLRRGSNILEAPRIVGQYLLGITIQSWSEFFNTSRLMRVPSNTQQFTRRLLTNLSHFQGNYLCVSLVLIIYCILTSPILLLAILAYLTAIYFVTAKSALGKQFRILGYKPNLQQQYSCISLVSLPLLWVAGAPSAVFWVIGASFVVVGLHASMYCCEQISAAITSQSYLSSESNNCRNTTAMPYYNHYPVASDCQYISLPAGSNQADTSQNSGIYQWMPFGYYSNPNTNTSNTVSSNQSTHLNPTCGPSRVPDVKIISHDYAGLGRVYEV